MSYLVSQTRRGHWQVKRKGASRADSVHKEKADAMARLVELAEGWDSQKIHVSPTRRGEWKVERGGSSRADSIHQDKEHAVARAKQLARSSRADRIIIYDKRHIFGTSVRKSKKAKFTQTIKGPSLDDETRAFLSGLARTYLPHLE